VRGRRKEGRREGGKEGRREGGKEGKREGGKEGRREVERTIYLFSDSPSEINGMHVDSKLFASRLQFRKNYSGQVITLPMHISKSRADENSSGSPFSSPDSSHFAFF
jgi:hypothetical protein